jgi:hypothetical protein
MIFEDIFKNVTDESGKVAGFELGVRIPYYRALILSCIEDYTVTVDGESFSKEKIKFSIDGYSFTHEEMELMVDKRCAFGQAAKLIVEKDGGLSYGEHDVSLEMLLRISYMPWTRVQRDNKKLKILI